MASELAKVFSGRLMDSWAGSRMVEWAAGPKASQETRERLRGELARFADELAGPSATPVERTLAETAALCWFSVRLFEAQAAGGATSEEGLTLKQMDHYQRRIGRAHRRLMTTLKTLATVRRLGMPALQINLARHQVNMSGLPSSNAD